MTPIDDRITGILGEWYELRSQGEEITPEEFIRRHPDLAEELRAHFEVLGPLERAFPPAPDLPPGTPHEVGEFRIVREIGRGGMGMVYEADQTTMGRRVALKILSPAVTGVEQAVQRFQQEARAAGSLHHTNIVPVYGMGSHEGLWYYAMELVEGPPLSDVIAALKGPTSEDGDRLTTTTLDRAFFLETAQRIAGVADALHEAHAEGIVHRDIKPQNLLLAADGKLKIVDFGLARLEGGAASMTVSGQLLGTPHYMSPEQAMTRRESIDHRTDIYSLGATLYEVLTQRLPFQGESLHEICSKIVSKDPLPPRKVNPRVPRDLETIVAKAMEKEPEKRYQSANEMALDLRRYADGLPIRARRIGPVGRAWRKVKRNKVRAALVSSVLALALFGILLLARAAREADRQIRLVYARLCSQAAAAVPRALDEASPRSPGGGFDTRDSALQLYGRAIDLQPDLPDAYLGRALVPGRAISRRLDDLDTARARGLSDGTWRLARAYLFRISGDPSRAEEEERLSGNGDVETIADLYFKARLVDETDRELAFTLLERVIEESAAESALGYLALRHRADLRVRAGDYPGALGDLLVVRSMGDEGVEVRIRIASLWHRMGREDEAESAFREACDTAAATSDDSGWASLCMYCRLVGERGWHAHATDEGSKLHPDSPALVRERAFALLFADRAREAIPFCRRNIAHNESDHAAHELLAIALKSAHEYVEAAAAYRQAIRLDPDCAAAHAALGHLLANAIRDDDGALTRLDRAIELDPGNAGALTNRGIVLERTGRREEALAAYRKAVEVRPRRIHSHERLWRCLELLGRKGEARAAMERAASSGLGGVAGARLAVRALLRLGMSEQALTRLEVAIHRHPRSIKLRLEHAEALLARGLHSEALKACNEVIRRRPRHDRAHERRGDILVSMKRFDDALSAYERTIELNPFCAGARFRKGNVLRLMKKFEPALAAYEAALAIDPHYARALTNKGVMLERLGKRDRALACYERAIELEENLIEAHLCRGAFLHNHLKRSREALAEFETALELDSDSLEAWVNKGVVLRALGEYVDALAAFTRASELDPANHRLWMTRGNIRWHLGRYPEAAAAFRKATELAPTDPSAWTRLGRALGLSGEEEKAVEALDRAIELDPRRYMAYQERGVSLRNLGKPEMALESFRKALELRPRSVPSRRWVGDMLLELVKYAEAVKAYDELLELAPNDHEAHNNRGVALMKLERLDDAVAAFERVSELRPDLAFAHLSRGRALFRLRRFKTAALAFEKVLEIDESQAFPRWRRALCLKELARLEEALSEVEKVVEAWPEEAEVFAERAWLLAWLGRSKAVPGDLDRAHELAPENEHVLRRRVWTFRIMEKYPEALEAARDLAAVAPRASGYPLASSLRALGRHTEARETAVGAVKRESAIADPIGYAYLCAVAGESEKARKALEAIEFPWSPSAMYERARVHAVLGEGAAAREWMKRAEEAGFRPPQEGKLDPDLKGLRDG